MIHYRQQGLTLSIMPTNTVTGHLMAEGNEGRNVSPQFPDADFIKTT
jgi:hypothetical protein